MFPRQAVGQKTGAGRPSSRRRYGRGPKQPRAVLSRCEALSGSLAIWLFPRPGRSFGVINIIERGSAKSLCRLRFLIVKSLHERYPQYGSVEY
jgi:hypothetical protein